jgi:putative tryptophan/tyrosine transport system substrate-binding protein
MKRRAFIAGVGAATAWPFAVTAQQTPKVSRIGWLGTPQLDSPAGRMNREAFLQGLRDLGYIEGQNIIIEYRMADGRIERLPELAAELVRLNVDLIVAGATPAGRAAQQATKTIPIIVNAMGDPVRDGLVASLPRPGGNITGTTFLGPELVPKRLALLKEFLPRISRIAVLRHPDVFEESTMRDMLNQTTDAAATLGVSLQFVDVRRPEDLDRAFSTIAKERTEALLPFPSTLFFAERKRIVELAATHRLPAMFNAREFVELGGFAAYGANLNDLFRRSVAYVDKILKGVKPSDLPVEQPTKFELVINLKTAKALGLTVPPSVLAQANEVIE